MCKFLNGHMLSIFLNMYQDYNCLINNVVMLAFWELPDCFWKWLCHITSVFHPAVLTTSIFTSLKTLPLKYTLCFILRECEKVTHCSFIVQLLIHEGWEAFLGMLINYSYIFFEEMSIWALHQIPMKMLFFFFIYILCHWG